MTSKHLSYTYRFGEKVVIGNIDLISSELESLFASENVHRVIFDLESCRICDTYGIQLFLSFQRKAEKTNIELILYRPMALFLEILRTAGLLHIFTVVEELDESETSEQ